MKKSLYGSGRTGSLVNRDSINMKIFEEGGGGGEGGRNFLRTFLPPHPEKSPILLVHPCGSALGGLKEERPILGAEQQILHLLMRDGVQLG